MGSKNLVNFFFIICTLGCANMSGQTNVKPRIEGIDGTEVNIKTGNLFYQRQDFYIPGQGLSIDATFSYNKSMDTINYGFGYGWTFNYNIHYEIDSINNIVITREAGRRDTFLLTTGNYESPTGVFDVLEKVNSDVFLLTSKYGAKFFFEDPSHKKLTKIEDVNGNSIILTYSDSNLHEISNSSGRSLYFFWSNNLLTQIRNENITPIRSIDFQYQNGNLISISDPLDNLETYQYNNAGSLVSKINKNGLPVTITYDDGGRVRKLISCLGELNFTYLVSQTLLVEKSSQNDRNTKFSFDEDGRLIEIVNPLGNSTMFSYDDEDNLVTWRDYNGNYFSYTYDDQGNVLAETDPLGNITEYTYNSLSRVTSLKDRNENTTVFNYDSNGNITSIIEPSGSMQTMAYDTYGNLIELVNANGKKTTYSYDNFDNLISVNYPIGSINFEYDGVGSPTKLVDVGGNEVQLTYNADNRPVAVVDPQGLVLTYTYDAKGNIATETDANGNEKFYTYDAMDRIIAVTTILGTTAYEYDFYGNIIAIEDANGNKTRFSVNLQDQITSQTDPLGNTSTYSYDPNGNLDSKIDANGNTTTYVYDPLNRLIQKSYLEDTDYYSYDDEGNLTNIANDYINISHVYDSHNRLVEKRYNDWNKTINYSYDDVGNISAMVDPNGGTTAYEYDDNNRVISVQNPLNEITLLVYDSLGRMIQKNFSNNTYANYTYNNADYLTALSYYSPSDEIISTYNYTYDLYGNKLTVEDGSGLTAYTYDGEHQVKTINYSNGNTEEYFYDNAGNRIHRILNTDTTNYIYDDADRIILADLLQFSFDNNGNTISKTESSHITTYTYDSQDRLLEVLLPNGESINYKYDPLGNRISREMSTGETTRFIYDDDNLLMELNGQNQTSTRFTSDLSVDSWISMNKNGSSYFYLLDGLGSISKLTDEFGDVVNSYEYDAFGNLLNINETVENNFLFTGRNFDRASGVYYFRNRYYAPEVGRFLTQDLFSGFINTPLSQNPYIYVENNPVNYVDPSGLGKIGLVIRVGKWGLKKIRNLSRDEAKRLFRKRGKDIKGSKTFTKKVSKNKGKKPIKEQHGEGNSHYHSGDRGPYKNPNKKGKKPGKGGRKGGHAFHSFAPITIPGATLGNDIFGDNLFGDAVNFFNPLSEIQDITDLFQDLFDEIFNIPRIHAVDPNAIVGPIGYDTARWVSVNDNLGFTIYFENDPDFATAPAQAVDVRLPIDPELDVFSLRLSNFGFGSFSFQTPPNSTFYSERLDVIDSLNVYVDVIAGVDVVKREVFWIFESIDPTTNLPPEDAAAGFLPVNDTTVNIYNDTLPKRGEGFVSFTIRPRANLATGDSISAQASIVFDVNAPLPTNTWHNLIDAEPPTSALHPLPAISDTTAVILGWSGVDDTTAVGVDYYDLYVSKDGTPFVLHQGNIDTVAYEFTGQEGSDYAFFVRAVDNVGNREALKGVGEDAISIGKEGLLVSPVVYLQGPYDLNSGLMDDNLRANASLPSVEPYAALDYAHVGGGGENIASGVFDASGVDAIVDWVFLELRDAADAAVVIATRSALLQRDGDIVDVDGVSPVAFANLADGNYYLVVKHRNHLGVMSAAPLAFSKTATVVDFTIDVNNVFGGVNGVAELGDGRLGLFSGDFNRNGQVQNTDYNAMISSLGIAGYEAGDFDLNGQVQNTDLQLKLIPNIGRGQPFGQ